jgi:hypothetical protein
VAALPGLVLVLVLVRPLEPVQAPELVGEEVLALVLLRA